MPSQKTVLSLLLECIFLYSICIKYKNMCVQPHTRTHTENMRRLAPFPNDLIPQHLNNAPWLLLRVWNNVFSLSSSLFSHWAELLPSLLWRFGSPFSLWMNKDDNNCGLITETEVFRAVLFLHLTFFLFTHQTLVVWYTEFQQRTFKDIGGVNLIGSA